MTATGVAACTFGEPLQRRYLLYRGASASADAPVLVLVHGISRRSDQLIEAFRAHADRHGLILIAPHFDKALYGQYQQVVDGGGARADLALLDMLNRIGWESGARVDKVHLFGFSGGAQFAHRFALLHPSRIASMTLAAAGWYTMPDDQARYPRGVRTHPLADAYDVASYLAIDRHVFVGADDLLRDPTLRRGKRLDAQQGTTRVERAQRWVAAMDRASRRAGIWPARSSFTILANVGHSFEGSTQQGAELPTRVMACIAPVRSDLA